MIFGMGTIKVPTYYVRKVVFSQQVTNTAKVISDKFNVRYLVEIRLISQY